MNFLKKSIKVLADLLMLFFLIGSVGNLWLLERPNLVAARGADDLGSVQLTVRQLQQPLQNNGFILLSNEYPAKFLLSAYPVPANMKLLLGGGTKVSVKIKKETIPHLQNVGLVYAYQLALADGTVLFDSRQYIPPRVSLTSFDIGNGVTYGMIALPLLYFIVRIWFYAAHQPLFKKPIKL